MLVFALSVLLFNLIFFFLLLLIRQRIPITTRVLLMTAPAAFICTVSLPYLAAVLDYMQLAVTFTGLILLFALLLTLADNRQPARAGSTAATGKQPEARAELNYSPQTEANPAPVEATPADVRQQVDQTTALVQVETEPVPIPESVRETMEPVPAVPEMISKVTEEIAATVSNEPETTPTAGEQLLDEQIEVAPEPELEPTASETPAGEETPAGDEETGPSPVSEPASTEPGEPSPGLPGEHPVQTEPTAVQQPESLSGEATDNQERELKHLITRGFSFKRSGHYREAAKIFYQALAAQPEPRLTVLLVLEISDIYREVGQTWQAAEILKILLKNWPDTLDARLYKRLELKFGELQTMLNQKGVQA